MIPIPDLRNVKDCYKGWLNDLIRDEVKRTTLPFSVMMSQISGDFNIGSIIRNGNNFGASTIYYYGPRKHYNAKGTVGTHIYSNVVHLKTIEEVKKLQDEYVFVAAENNIENVIPYETFTFPRKTMFIFGEEGSGIPSELMELADVAVDIYGLGSVRSINVASAAAVLMAKYCEQHYGFRKR